MPVCAVCSSPASSQCARCKSVSYCSPAHQKEDWHAHKIQCPRLAQEALSAVFKPCDEELLLRITTCLAQNGYYKEVGVMVQLNKAFWNDEQIWDAYKDVPGAGGRTRLMAASACKLIDRVRWFIARGAQVKLAAHDGITSLVIACLQGHLETAQLLIDKGANVNAAMSVGGRTILMCASMQGYLEITRLLIDKGANVNAATTDSGFTALMWASERGHLEIARLLIDKGAKVNAARADDGQTALMWASDKGHLEITRLLLECGANADGAPVVFGLTPLFNACMNGQLEIARLLVKYGANVNMAIDATASVHTAGCTPLMIASKTGCLPLVQLLLAQGANKNSVSASGATALSLAKTLEIKKALK